MYGSPSPEQKHNLRLYNRSRYRTPDLRQKEKHAARKMKRVIRTMIYMAQNHRKDISGPRRFFKDFLEHYDEL